MRTILIALLLAGVMLAGCNAEESNESGEGTGASGVGEGGDDVDPCDDQPTLDGCEDENTGGLYS